MNYNHAVNLQRQIQHQTNYVVEIGCFHGCYRKQYKITIKAIQGFWYYSTNMVRFALNLRPINVQLNANSTNKNG